MYPHPKGVYYGIFVKEQIESLHKYHNIKSDIFFVKGFKSKVNYILSIWKIRRLIKKNHYDLIHIHYGLTGLFLLLGKKISIPVLITLHGGDILKEYKKYLQVFLTKKIIKKANYVITLNNEMYKIVTDLNCSTQIIPCAVNTHLFYSNRIKEKHNEPLKIIFASYKYRAVKNYPLFAEVISILRKTYDMNIEEIELAYMSREEVRKCMQTSDLLLLTSFAEGSPQVIKEAMACNLPIVSTNIGDVKRLLSGVKNCAVSNSFQPEELASLALKALSDEIPGVKSSEKIKDLKIDEESIANQIYEVYCQLMKQ